MLQDILNIQPNKISTELTSYNFLLYSLPGVGKTTFATKMFPERALILGAEFGYKGIPGAMGMPVPNYFTLIKIAEALDTPEAREKYDTLIIDTTTKVGEMIEEYILSMYGKDNLGDCKAHGGAYPLINRYYNMVFNKLKARGYNFVYICHAKAEDIKNEKNEVIGQRYTPNMSSRIAGLIEPEVDYTFFITLNKNTGDRIIVTDNTPQNLGKQRTNLPTIMPLDIENFKSEFAKGIEEKAQGQIINEKVQTTVTNFKQEERPYTEMVAEIKALGQELVEISKEKATEALTIVNNRLGLDNNGIQRTLDQCTQQNAQMLETIIFELKKLK